MATAPELPLTIPFADLKAALGQLGLPSDCLLEVRLTPRSVQATYRRVDDDRRSVAAGDQIATVVTTIGVDRTDTA